MARRAKALVRAAQADVKGQAPVRTASAAPQARRRAAVMDRVVMVRVAMDRAMAALPVVQMDLGGEAIDPAALRNCKLAWSAFNKRCAASMSRLSS